MDAIKKKMIAMKMEKESALDRAEQMEQNLRETNEAKAKVDEDFNALQKKYSHLENEFDTVNEQLIEARAKLEEKEKRVTEIIPTELEPFGRYSLFSLPFWEVRRRSNGRVVPARTDDDL